MNKRTLLSLLLAGVVALSACGASTAVPAQSDAAKSTPQEPAQSAMAPVVTPVDQPDVSEPDVSAPDASAQEQQPDAGQIPEAPAVKPVAPPKAETPAVTKPKPQPEPQDPDSSGEICELPLAPADDDPPAEPEPKPAPTAADAQAYIGKSVSSLIAAIGAPKGRDYAPSCLGDGEDGELFYDSFTVYTYRLNGVETVQDVV